MKNFVINAEVDMVSILAEYGRFLETDYRMIIEHLEIPKAFEEYVEPTNRKFVIVGAKDTPWVLPKSVFLCLKLGGPDSIVVSTPNIDENFMVQNVFDYYANDVRNRLFIPNSNDLKISREWQLEVENATDIIVFGNEETMLAYRDLETVDRRVWEHGQRFSFGIVRAEHLTPTIINQICFDFFSFYGEGSLAPKVYFIIGEITSRIIQQFSSTMMTFYRMPIEEYRDKLPVTRKSDLIKSMLSAKYFNYYVRNGSWQDDRLFDTLYGDVKLIQAYGLEDIEDFINKWQDRINTVAVNIDDDMDTQDFLEDRMVIRICPPGEMQFPDFFEQYANVDDFIIYADEGTDDLF